MPISILIDLLILFFVNLKGIRYTLSFIIIGRKKSTPSGQKLRLLQACIKLCNWTNLASFVFGPCDILNQPSAVHAARPSLCIMLPAMCSKTNNFNNVSFYRETEHHTNCTMTAVLPCSAV